MKKVCTSIAIMTVLIFIGIEILTSSKYIMESVSFSFKIWQENIFPSLFPFFVLSEILTQYGFIELIGELMRPLMQSLFRIKGECAFIFIMSIISGFPSNAKYTRELYLNGTISESEASKVLTFTHFSNPLFIMGTVALLFLNNKEVGLLILLCHYSTNIIIGLIFRDYAPSEKDHTKISLKRAILKMHEKRIHNHSSFGKIITNSLQNAIQTLVLILGVVTMFLVITTMIDQNLNIDSYHQSILNGFIEMTQGLKYVSLLDIPLKFKSTITAMILSFGGLSVHMQMIGILSDTKIKYLPFFTARLLHASIASFLVYFLFDYWSLLI